MTFVEFDRKYNEVTKSYVPLKGGVPREKGPITPLDFTSIVELAGNTPDLEIGWIIPEGHIVIDIDDRVTADIVMKIIKARKEKVLVVNTTRGIHIHAKSNYNNKTVNNITAVGAVADTIVHGNGKSFITMPFKNPKVNTSERLKTREVIYYNGIDKLPFWLVPIFKRGNRSQDNYITFPLYDARNDTYNRHLWRLKMTVLSPTERAETIRVINEHVAVTPLSDIEMENTMLRDENNESLPETEFFDNNTFLHDKLGQHLIERLKIKKCKETKLLYFYNEDRGIYVTNDEYIKAIMTRTVPKLKDFQKRETLTYIGNYLELDLTTFNENPLQISFTNGVLDLVTLKLEPHSPEHLETISLAVDYNPKAVGPTADKFFADATLNDPEVEQLLYEAIGYTFLKTPELNKAFLLIGEGRNGKSTYLDLIQAIVGSENTTSIDFKDLEKQFRVSMLFNKLVSLAGDISSQPLKESDLFKQITGGDDVSLERKHQDAFSAKLFATLMFSANTLPRTPDTSYGFYRRLCIVPFYADLSGVSLIEGIQFKENLMKDLEYVAYKSVMAVHNIFTTTKTFIEPKVVKDLMQTYRIENSSVLSWVESKEIDRDYMKDKNKVELYSEYKIWAEINSFKPVRSTRFESELMAEYNLKLKLNMFIDK